MTTAFGEEWRSTLQEIGDTAQRALRERPSVSIRMRVVLGFVLWIILSLGLAIISMITISRIQQKLHFLQATDSYTFEIQQARRFEKNFFLYHTNLEDALEHVHNAGAILSGEKENITNVVGENEYQVMGTHLSRYEDLLLKLKDGNPPASIADVEAELREHGAEMVIVAEELVEKERKTVNAMLATAQRIPMAFLFVLILSTAYFAAVIARQVFAPLKRLVNASRRIADGDLTPIQPAKTYRDEFSDLAIAMNHMLLHLLKRHEMLLQAHKLKAVGTLTAGVAHELNNPINNIMLSASMLYEDYDVLDDSDRKDMANDMVTESERAQKIVRNLLDFARESDVESEHQDIQDIIENTLRLASNQIKLANVKVKGELAANPPPIFVDRRQVEQVFLNIVLNALDAMPDGGTLTICCDNAQGNEFISVDFTDTGTGIPEEKLSDIFNPFYTTKPDAKGTGLGLSVSLGIIKQHGGDIKVKSKVGEGTTFTVLLPVAQVPAAIPNDH
jgi:signal transduction histidine kinase